MSVIEKGLYTDADPINQPNGLLYDALNVVFKKNGSISNENGNESFIKRKKIGDNIYATSTLDAIPIGHVQLDTTRIILFLCSSDNSHNEIGILHANGTYESFLIEPALNFRTTHPIHATAKIEGDDIIIAWTDNYNKPRVMNLSNMPFKSGLTPLLSLVEPTEITFIDVTPNNMYGNISVSNVFDAGGRLSSGSYEFFFCYETEDGTKLPYSEPTRPVIINDDSVSSGYEKYDGCNPGKVTTKSIGLTLTLSTLYPYINIYVIKTINGVSSIYHVSKRDVVASMTYTYSGYEDHVAIATEDYMIPKIVYAKGKVIFSTNDGKLGLANLEGIRDIGYQKYANNIKVYCRKKSVGHHEYSMSYIKNNAYISINRSFMPGEVYALYIAFSMKDGTMSYAYHIPGRDVEYINGITISGSPQYENVTVSSLMGTYTYLQADDSISPGRVKYFHTRDTAWYSSTGMGYWENRDEEYPQESADRNGDWEIWDSSGKIGSLHGKKVRHHKFPTMRSHGGGSNLWYDNDTKSSFIYGIDIQNIYLPPEIKDNVVGIHIFMAKRDVNNMSILGNGLLFHSQLTSSGTENGFSTNAFDLMINGNGQLITHISNEYLVKLQRELDVTHTGVNEAYIMYDRPYSMTVAVPNEYYIRKVTNIRYNGDSVTDGASSYYASRMWGELSFINNTVTPYLINKSYSGSGTNPQEHYLTNFCVFRENMYMSFSEQPLVLCVSNYTENDNVFCGDTYTMDYAFRIIQKDPGGTVAHQGKPSDSIRRLYYHPTMGMYHAGFRYEDEYDTTDDKRYYPKESDVWNYLKMDITNRVNNYSYDPVYSRVGDIHHGVAYPITEDKETIFKTRIIISDILSDTTKVSSWKEFLANNYYDIDNRKGEIVNVVSIGDELLINTTRSLFKTIGSKKLKIDEISTYIGTGEIFGVAPQEQSITDDGYAGCQNRHSCLKLPTGYFYVNQDYGLVFMYDGRLREISAIGNRNWFKENLPSKLKESINRTDNKPSQIDINFDNPINGVGIIAEYDKRYDRVILTKIDYKIRDDVTYYGAISGVSGPLKRGLYYVDVDDFFIPRGKFCYHIPPFDYYDVWFDNDGIFENCSWTMSYSLEKNQWVSWHSYKPTLMMRNDIDLFISNANDYSNKDIAIYRMNVPNKYGIFMDEGCESYIEYVINSGVDYSIGKEIPNVNNKIFDVIEWVTTVLDSNNINLYDETLTNILIYNENQCSGLIVLGNNIKEVSGTWRLNYFRDLVIDYKSKFLADGKGLRTSDKLLSLNIDYNKLWYKRYYFTGKYIVVRFIYDNIKQNSIDFHGYNCRMKSKWL